MEGFHYYHQSQPQQPPYDGQYNGGYQGHHQQYPHHQQYSPQQTHYYQSQPQQQYGQQPAYYQQSQPQYYQQPAYYQQSQLQYGQQSADCYQYARSVYDGTSTAQVYGQRVQGRRKALLIGIRYLEEPGMELSGSHADVKEMYYFLTLQMGWRPEDIKCGYDTVPYQPEEEEGYEDEDEEGEDEDEEEEEEEEDEEEEEEGDEEEEEYEDEDEDEVEELSEKERKKLEREASKYKDHPMPPSDFEPTRANILKYMDWLIQDARAGDSLVLLFTGHGGQEEDEDGDEEDGYDETICPVDSSWNGDIIDDEIHAKLVAPLPAGVRLVAVFDCCNSESGMDLPYKCIVDPPKATKQFKKLLKYDEGGLIDEWKITTKIAKEKRKAEKKAKKGKKGKKLKLKKLKNMLKGRRLDERGNQIVGRLGGAGEAILFSGCNDGFCSTDTEIGGIPCGILCYSLSKSLRENPNASYKEILRDMRIAGMKYSTGFAQIPQLSYNHSDFDINQPFFV